MVRVLLFRGADGAPKAAYLDQVAGLEEVDLKAVDHSRGLWVMRSGSDLLPLVAVDPAAGLPSGARAPVIVFTVDRQSFGLLVDAIPEVADVMPQEPASRDSGRAVLLNGKPIEVIDPARYLDRAIRARVERRRPDRKRSSAAEPSMRDDLFVRKPAR
jgi:chemotaxis signal transduction protein